MGTNLKAVWSVYRSMLCISVCSNMVHNSFINKGIVEHQPTIVIECISVLIVKTCHTLNRLAKQELIKKTHHKQNTNFA